MSEIVDKIDQFLAGVQQEGEKQSQDQATAVDQARAMVQNPTPETFNAAQSPEALSVANQSLNQVSVLGNAPKGSPGVQAIEEGQKALAASAPLTKIDMARANLNMMLEAAQQGRATPADVIRAEQQLTREMDFSNRLAAQTKATKAAPRKTYTFGGVVPKAAGDDEAKGYADGGVVTPDPIDSFLSAPSAVRVPAGGAMPGGTSSSGIPAGLDEFIKPDMLQSQYGGVGQQALAGLEGAGQGATFGLSTGLETALGVNPESIRGRAEANPVTHVVGQVAGLAGSSLIPGVGEANLLAKAGETGAGALGLGVKGASFVSQVGADAVKGAFEAGLFQGGEEVSKAFAQDPHQTAQTAIADIGMASLLGGAFSGAVGGGLRASGLGGKLEPEIADAKKGTESLQPQFVSQMDVDALERGDFKTLVKHDNTMQPGFKDKVINALDLGKQKENAKEIIDAQKYLGLPTTPGMTAASPVVQMSVDTLAHSPYTLSGKKVADQLESAYTAAEGALQSTIQSTNKMSKEQLGSAMQESLTTKIRDAYAPIQKAYGELAEHYPIIEVDKGLIEQVGQKLKEIPEVKITTSSPESKLVRRVLSAMDNAKTAEDLNTIANMADLKPQGGVPGLDPLSWLKGRIKDSLNEVRESSVAQAAKSFSRNDEAGAYVASLVEAADRAKAAYKPYIKRVGELSEWLGKGKINGTESALSFMNEKLSASDVANKLFKQKDPSFYKFFSREFPEEFQQVRNFQRAQLIEDATHANTGFSPKAFFRKFEDMEPEVKKALYSADEIKKVEAAKTYINNAFPTNFNPSGTSHIEAFRKASEAPKAFIVANIRDKALQNFIDRVNTPELKAANGLARSTVKAYDLVNKATRSILNPDKVNMPAAIAVSVAARDKIKKKVEEYAGNPQAMLEIASNAPVPVYSAAMSMTAANAVGYLNSIRPKTDPKSPLDKPREPSQAEVSRYNRAVDIVQQPLLVMKHLKDGTLQAQDIQTLKAVYPALYQNMSDKLLQEVIQKSATGTSVPYQVRMGLSLFLHQPLDSTMTPQAIQSAQAVQSGQQAPQTPMPAQAAGKPKGSPKALTKLPGNYSTPDQARAQRALKQ